NTTARASFTRRCRTRSTGTTGAISPGPLSWPASGLGQRQFCSGAWVGNDGVPVCNFRVEFFLVVTSFPDCQFGRTALFEIDSGLIQLYHLPQTGQSQRSSCTISEGFIGVDDPYPSPSDDSGGTSGCIAWF